MSAQVTCLDFVTISGSSVAAVNSTFTPLASEILSDWGTNCGGRNLVANAEAWAMVVPAQTNGWELDLAGGAAITAAMLGVWALGWAFGQLVRLVQSS